MAEDRLPRVVGGKLDRPYPIRTAGDVQRARVLPPPRMTKAAPAAPARPTTAARSMGGSEQPRGAVDYVRKRNALSRELSGGRR